MNFDEVLHIAESGNAEAQYAIGAAYLDGENIEQDFKLAFYWISKAAEQGYRDAQTKLGTMYANGTGVQKDIESAILWYVKAGQQGDPEAQYQVGSFYTKKEPHLSYNIVAARWLRQAAEQGHAGAQLEYATFFEFGLGGLVEDTHQAFLYVEKSAKQGNAEAQVRLGLFYLRGVGCTKNFENAKYWIQQSVNKGNAEAEYYMGFLYWNKGSCLNTKSSNLIEKVLSKRKRRNDMKAAIELFKSASKKGYSQASYELGEIYSTNMWSQYGIVENLIEAEKWYQTATQQGNKDAANKMQEISKRLTV